MKSILSLAVAVAFVVATSGHSQASPVVASEIITTFEQFKQAFNKNYATPEEESLRKANFEQALKFIQENQQNPHGVKLGLNENSDLSASELTLSPESMAQLIRELNATPTHPLPLSDFDESEYESRNETALPTSFDWRDLIQVNPIEHQGTCGSCWAFATTFTVEAQLAFRNQTYVSLSKQELVDCSSNTYDNHYRNVGCQIGYPDDTYSYIMTHGLYTEQQYPYNGQNAEVCYTSRLASQQLTTKYHIKSYNRLQLQTPDETIMSVLHQYGPTVVVIHGTDPHFAQYKGGIIRLLLPNSAEVNHVVGVVGWGTEGGVDYWVIRNSWGVGWGEQGYARIERHHNNIAFNNWVSYPIF